MKNVKKFFALSLSCILVISSLTACKKKEEGPTKEELQSQLLLTQNELANVQYELQGAKEVLATYNQGLSNVDLSSITILPTGQEAYTSINDKIRLSTVLEMKPSASLPNTTEINLGGNIKYIPSNNWTFELSNNVLILQHKNGMILNLKVYKYTGSATQYDVMDTVIRPYLQNLSVTEVGSKKLFMNQKVVGGMILNNMLVKNYKDSNLIEGYIEETKNEIDNEEEYLNSIDSDNLIETNTDDISVSETNSDDISVSESKEDVIPEAPNTGFGTLDEESSVELNNESSVNESDLNNDNLTENESVVETNEVIEDLSDLSKSSELNIITEPDYEVEEYNYNVAVVFSGDYALTIEAFYKNDENAPIQEELFTSSLSSIQVNGNKLVSE